MFRKSISLFLAGVLAAGVLAGCGGKTDGTKPAEGGSTPTQQKEKVLRYNAGTDFRSLDPALATDLVAFDVINAVSEGLVRDTEKGIVPGLAKEWQELDGGTKYVFTLRDGIKWSNGDPITADDFVYSWQRTLDPRTGAEYAYQMYYVKGGEALNSVKVKDNPNADKDIEAALKNLGVKALDPKTLEVTLEAPTPYFVGLTAFVTLLPVSKKAVTANKDWAIKPETYVGSGPFKLTKWSAKQELVVEKNPNYWDAANIKLDKIVYYMVEEQATSLNMWETDQIEMMDSPPPAELARLKKENKLKAVPSYGTYYYFFNTQVKPFDDARVRKALALALDRKAIVDNVTRGGQVPAFAFVAPGSPDADGKTDFRKVGGDLFKEDLAEAKRLLADAGYPDGKGFPETTFIYNTNETHKAIGEAVIEMWKQNLGITSFKMQNTEWKVVLDQRTKGDYQLARAGWYGDYLDAMTFIDLMMTTSGNNDAKYSNSKFDDLVKKAKSTSDQKVRMESMHAAEKILIEDMPVLPLYYYVNLYLQKENVSGVYRNALGVKDFKFADVK